MARGENKNPYSGGKIRKQTSRSSKKTPYDRNSLLGGGDGWFSRLLDPARMFFYDTADWMFGSLFQSQLPERDVIKETEDTSASMMELVQMEDNNGFDNSTKDGFVILENILKESTFTSSQLERLTTLLRSKAGDSSTVNRDQRNEVSIVSPGKLITEEKVLALEKPEKAAAVFPTMISSPAATELSQNTDASADIRLEKTSSSAVGVSEASAKPTESNKAVRTSDSDVEVPSTAQTVAATPTAFSEFGKLPLNTSNDNNSGSNSQSSSAASLSSTSTLDTTF